MRNGHQPVQTRMWQYLPIHCVSTVYIDIVKQLKVKNRKSEANFEMNQLFQNLIARVIIGCVSFSKSTVTVFDGRVRVKGSTHRYLYLEKHGTTDFQFDAIKFKFMSFFDFTFASSRVSPFKNCTKRTFLSIWI